MKELLEKVLKIKFVADERLKKYKELFKKITWKMLYFRMFFYSGGLKKIDIESLKRQTAGEKYFLNEKNYRELFLDQLNKYIIKSKNDSIELDYELNSKQAYKVVADELIILYDK